MIKAYVNMFKNYVNFGGKTNRGEFWKAIIANAIIAFVITKIFMICGPKSINKDVVDGIYGLIIFLPLISITVRRLNDAGKKWMNILWGLIPIVGTLILIIKLLQPSVVFDSDFE